jgi:hypothetical protein
MKSVLAAAVIGGLLTACGTVPTPQGRPDRFERLHAARYAPAMQLEFMDCVFDSFATGQSAAGAMHVRQVRRADGYRLDLISGPFQYLIADFKTDGTYELRRAMYASQVSLGREEEAAKACLFKFSIT